MKKEIDVYKIESLIDVFNSALLWAWYLSGVLIAACLWFFQLPSSSIQTFAFAGAFIWYSILSVSITKIKQIKLELRS